MVREAFTGAVGDGFEAGQVLVSFQKSDSVVGAVYCVMLFQSFLLSGRACNDARFEAF